MSNTTAWTRRSSIGAVYVRPGDARCRCPPSRRHLSLAPCPRPSWSSGAGFGGLELVHRGSRQALGDDVDVTLIDARDAFVFGFSKLDVMFGERTPEAVRLPVRATSRSRACGSVQETITAIDPRGAARRDRRRHLRGRRPRRRARRRLRHRRRRPGWPRPATSSTRSPAPSALRDVLAGFTAGERDRRRLRRAVQVPAGAERGRAAADDYLRDRGVARRRRRSRS